MRVGEAVQVRVSWVSGCRGAGGEDGQLFARALSVPLGFGGRTACPALPRPSTSTSTSTSTITPPHGTARRRAAAITHHEARLALHGCAGRPAIHEVHHQLRHTRLGGLGADLRGGRRGRELTRAVSPPKIVGCQSI